MSVRERIREQLRATRRGTFTVGDFDEVKTKAARVADLIDKAAAQRARFYAPDIDKILRSMRRIQRALSNLELDLAEFRRRQ